jgi:hypothetical protein
MGQAKRTHAVREGRMGTLRFAHPTDSVPSVAIKQSLLPHGTPAVHGDDLAGDVVGVADQEERGAGDVGG